MPISASGYGSGYATPITAGSLTPLGYQQLVLEDAEASALTVPTGARLALIQVEWGDVRWRDDGQDPDDSVGVLLKAGETMIYDGDLAALRLIEVDDAAAINISYYG